MPPSGWSITQTPAYSVRGFERSTTRLSIDQIVLLAQMRQTRPARAAIVRDIDPAVDGADINPGRILRAESEAPRVAAIRARRIPGRACRYRREAAATRQKGGDGRNPQTVPHRFHIHGSGAAASEPNARSLISCYLLLRLRRSQARPGSHDWQNPGLSSMVKQKTRADPNAGQPCCCTSSLD